jgi:uncharacterized membrane protein
VIIYIAGSVVTLLAAAFGYSFFGRTKTITLLQLRPLFLSVVVGLSITYVVVFSLMKDLTVLSHHSYLDYAVFLEYFNNYATGRGMHASIQENAIQGTAHWFSVHFTPLYYPFSFLFKLLPSFHTINWSQTVFLASSSVVLYLLAKARVGAFSALCLSLALLLNPTLQYITLYEFEYLRFVIPLGVLAVGLVLLRAHWSVIVLASLGVLLVREDASLLILGLGIFIIFFQKDRRLLGAGLVILSVAYLLIIVKVVMPLFQEPGSSDHVAAYWFYEFGKTPLEIMCNIALQPVRFLEHLFHPYKLINYPMFILPFSFIPLVSLETLVIMLPSFALLSFSGAVTHISYFLYYVSPIIVVVVWAAVLGVPRLNKYLSEHRVRFSLLRHLPQPTIERISFSVLTGSLACSIYFGPSPLSIQFWNRDFTLAPFRTNTFYKARYIPTAHDDVVRKVAATIPTDAAVSAEHFLLVDVYKNRMIKVFPSIEGVDYIFIDKSNPIKTGGGSIPGSWDGLRRNPQFYYDWVEKRPDVFERIYDEDGVFLFKRQSNAPSYPQPNAAPP